MEAALQNLASIVYPGLSPPAALRSESGREIADWACALIPARYPTAVAGFVGQSSSVRERSPYSDIDILVVVDAAANYSRSCTIVAGRPLEAQIIGADHIEATIEFARRSGAPLVVGFADDADVVFDPQGRAHGIQNRLREAFAMGPAAQSPQQILYLREGITGLLLDLGPERPRDERIACGLALYDQLCTLFFAARGLWISRGKYAIREIRRLDPSVADAFMAAYAALITGSSAELISLADQLLAPIGGPLWHGFYSQRNLTTGRVVAGDFRAYEAATAQPPKPAVDAKSSA